MTYAPQDLLTVRQYLLAATGLAGDAVGIVGDPAHASTGGYHEGENDLARVGRASSDYSVRESGRDSGGLTDAASALDIGDAWKRGPGLRAFSLALVHACSVGAPGTQDIREVIYTPDGSSVRRWDRLGIRSTGDSSHLFHTHISFFRDSEGRRADPGNVLGLLKQLITGIPTNQVGDDMSAASEAEIERMGWRMVAMLYDSPTVPGGTLKGEPNQLHAQLAALTAAAAADATRDATATAAIQALTAAIKAGGGSVDSAPIIAAIQAAKAETVSAVQELQQQNADLRARLAEALAAPAAS